MMRGVSIRLFLADGDPSGLWIVEKSGWTGLGLMWPRVHHSEARKRQELERPGVYVLVGPAEESDRSRVYIGEADVLRKRLDQHHASKDFWTRAVAFTAKDDNLNKADVKYLESRLLAIANEVQRSEIDNGNTPQSPSLSEADIADGEAFLDEMLLLFPVLDVRAFERIETPSSVANRLQLSGPGAKAEGAETSDGFVVFAGATARADCVPSTAHGVIQLRTSLIETGLLVATGGGLQLRQDRVFTSPSIAAAVFLARSANGRIEWKGANGWTLKDLQKASVGRGR